LDKSSVAYATIWMKINKYWTKNNLPHQFTTDKDLYLHVVTLCTQTDLKYRLVVKEKRNIYVHGISTLCAKHSNSIIHHI